MSLAIIPFKKVEQGARFHHEGIQYQKCGNSIAYPIMDSDEPDEHIFVGTELCSTKVDSRTGKKSL